MKTRSVNKCVSKNQGERLPRKKEKHLPSENFASSGAADQAPAPEEKVSCEGTSIDRGDTEAAAELSEQAETSLCIPVVGIGGSAGSLEAFKVFFTAVPISTGAAFVVIQHLAPAHASMLTEILAQYTQMSVVEATDGMPVKPDTVYVIPPSHYMAIRGGALLLTEPVLQHGIRMPIDFFFRSLAEDRQERAVCILFSGAGSDGTLGVRAVRGNGGLTVVQDPETAQFSDMPCSAVATGLVDFVLPPEKIPEALMDYLSLPYARGEKPAAVREATAKPGGVADILSLLRTKVGYDFRCYKKSTIARRIERRMGLHRIADLAAYLGFLQEHDDEASQLLKDLLINVTSFFRDAEAFEELRLQAIVPLVQAKSTDEPLRVWVAGCSTGEEAYSLAMLLLEETSAVHRHGAIQVFATDIDEEALQFARVGLYPESIAMDVGPKRLAKFFVRKDTGYAVSEMLRATVVFATQNLLVDPPFSKMDLVSCRNLLIYLDAGTQEKLIPLFHFALNPGGYLFQGKSESIGRQNNLFEIVSKTTRIYRRLAPPRPVALDLPILPGTKRKIAFVASAASRPSVPASYAEMIRQALLSHFAATVVLSDRKGQVLQFHGQTGKYLDLPTTEPNLNLLDMARAGLSRQLRVAMHKAATEGATVAVGDVPFTGKAGSPFVRVTVMPLAWHQPPAEPLLAVIFEDVSRPATVPGVIPVAAGGNETFVRQLEDELRITQQDLQANIEELQASNEELRVANEEVISTNEELQSTNEELETSKEELQSVNEELTTVNSQLQDKIERLDAANSDLTNFLEATEIATLFLDSELRIKRFTPAATRVIKLIPSDVGRPLGDLSLNFTGYDLTADARTVARDASVIEREVSHADGASYLVRVIPYHTPKGQMEGVVVTLSDVTRLRRAEKQTRRLATVLKDSNDAVILFDQNGNIQAWNRGAQVMYGWCEDEALTMNMRQLTPPDREPEFAELVRRLLTGDSVASYETQRRTKDGRILEIWLTAAVVVDESKRMEAFATTERDITDRQCAHKAIADAKREWECTFNSLPDLITILDTDHHIVRVNQAMADRLGRTPSECVGKVCYEQVNGCTHPIGTCPHSLTLKDGDNHTAEVNDARLHEDFLVTSTPLHDADGKLFGAIHIARDITERKRAEANERAALARTAASQTAANILNAMDEGVLLLDMKGCIVSVNPALEKMNGIPVGEMINLDVRGLLHELLSPEDAAIAENALNVALKGQTPTLPPLTVLSRTGRRVPVIPSVTFVCDPSRQPTEIVVTLRDISELHVLSTALEESNALLERVFDNTHLSLVYLDRDFNFVRVNRAYADACQHASDFFTGKNHFSLYPHPENEAIFRRVVETGETSVEHERPFVFPDHPEFGVTYWDWTLRPLQGEKDQVENLLFCLLDVTARVQARQGLVESEQKYRELVENANSIIMRVTPEHNITFFNEYAQTFFGYSMDEVVGRNVLGTIAPEIDSEGRNLRDMLKEITDHPELCHNNENENICKDGRRVWMHWANRGVRNEMGNLIEILSVGTDITKRKELEAEAARYQKRLQELAERLITSEEEDRWRISRYIHDTIIQNLSLSTVKMGALRGSLTKAKLNDHVSKLDATRALIEKATAECRSVMSDLTPVLLYELGLIPALRDLADQVHKQHNVRSQVDAGGEDIPMDSGLRGLLFQSTREFVMNALKHAEPSDIKISVERQDNQITVQVQDNGKGFDPANLNQRGDGHSGFGFFSIRERVEGLGGRLEIESAPSLGTTARIVVPIASQFS